MSSLKAKFIIEIMGRPAEHLEKSLSELVENLGKDKGVSLLRKEIQKPKKVESADNLWSTFADIELSFESLPLFFNAIMTYMPAHIEIYEPEMFKMNAFEMNEFANFVIARLHNYDALAKRMISEREILINKLEFLRKGGDPKVVFTTAEPKQTITEDKKAKKKTKKSK